MEKINFKQANKRFALFIAFGAALCVCFLSGVIGYKVMNKDEAGASRQVQLQEKEKTREFLKWRS